MKKCFWAVLIAALAAAACATTPDNSTDKQVEEILSQMTLSEKIAVVHAQSKFSSPGVPRLGIPELWCDDGPHGVRPETLWDAWASAKWTNDSCTAYPSLTALAASWDRSLALAYGKSVGEEARYRKKNVLLGPGVNICRTPLCGRNFEYMGEDPLLAGEMAAEYIKGVQSNHVAACVKHFAVNNQEFERQGINVHVSERALREIYLPAFKKAVDAGVWSIMSAYNRFEGEYASHNKRLLKDILKEEWGFDGAVISDWGAVHDTDGAANGGLDLEYGTHTDGVSINTENAYDKYYLAEAYKQKILAGELPESELDDKVRRVLRLNLRTIAGGNHGSMCSPEHFALARKIGAEGITLLKNEGGVLPLRSDARKIVVLGENAIRPMVVGGSSSSLKTQHEISPLDGIRAAFPDAEVVYCRTWNSGQPTPGNYNYSQFDITETRSQEELLAEAMTAVEGADYVIFFGGINKNRYQDCEGQDRREYWIPGGQNTAIAALSEKRPDLIYVNISGTPVAMPFAGSVAAIVQAYYLGSETGNALADVLTGAVNPSGKLPFTFPVLLEDGPIKTERQYPGIQDENGRWQVYYDEGIFVGYRWYDSKGIEPLFPFGYGLSYTSFDYSDASVKVAGGKLKAAVTVRNSGAVDGAEVVQLYVSAPAAGEGPAYERPAQELKGFEKVYLAAGESRKVSIEVPLEDLGYYDEAAADFVTVKGQYTARIGSSSRDIRSEKSFTVR